MREDDCSGFSLQRIFRWTYAVYAWTLFAFLLLVFGGAIILVRKPSIGRRIGKIGARLLLLLGGIPLSISGLENLPQKTHILLVNHTSFLDGFALIALLPATPGYSFTVRQEFGFQRLFCSLLSGLGTVVLRRLESHARESGLEKILRSLEEGKNLVVFPEGRLRPEAGLMPFHSGAFVAAAKTNVPVVVAALTGARNVLPPKRWLPTRSPVVLKIGTPLLAKEDGRHAIDELMLSARAAMVELMAEGS